jgi:DNA-binding beta-propeller fold protein YncE
MMTARTPLFLLPLCLTLACEREVVYPPGLSWGEPAVPPYAGQARLGVSNNSDDTLSFVSIDSLDRPRLLGTARVGRSPVDLEGPHHLIGAPDGRFIYFNLSNYVTGGGGGPHGQHGTGTVPGYLVKLDARTLRPLGEVVIDRSPGDVILSADGKVAYVSHFDQARLLAQLMRGDPPESGYSSVAIVDTQTMQLLAQPAICPTAHGQGLSPDGRTLYVSCSESDEVAVVDVSDPAKPKVRKRVPVGMPQGRPGDSLYFPYALSVHRDGSVWISNNRSQDVRVLDPQTLAMDDRRRVAVEGLAMFGDFSPDGRMLYVPSQGRGEHVWAIDTASPDPNGTKRSLAIPGEICLAAHALVVLPGGRGAALVCEGDHRARRGTVVFIDLAAWEVRGHVEAGLFPDGGTLLPPL